MAGTTTAMATSFKKELPMGFHNFLAQVTPTGNTTNASAVITSMSSVTGLSVGMGITGTGIPANSVIASIDSSSQITISKAATATNTGTTLTISGDAFSLALVKTSPTGTYDATTTNYSNLTGNSDEVSGTGYSAGGYAWTAAMNISPATTSTTAYWSWTTNPSWTSASFSTTGAILYNTAAGRSGTANRAVAVFDFGGTQTVTAGTFTVVLPTNNNSTAILRIQ